MQNADAGDLGLLRSGREWRKQKTYENDREPYQLQGHLGWGRLPGSLAERHDAHQRAHRLKISVTEGDPVDQKSRLPIPTRRAP